MPKIGIKYQILNSRCFLHLRYKYSTETSKVIDKKYDEINHY